MQNLTIIGVDNGYGNTKTAHHCFPTAVVHHGEKAPAFKNDLLHYQGQYYTIGTGHKTFTASKVEDEDTYLLTLAALAMELKTRGLQSAKVFLAVGLPLTWVTTQKAAFKKYLLQNQSADFTFNGRPYHVDFAGCLVFPQGAAAVADRIEELPGVTLIADIGNGTMNLMYVHEGKAQIDRCFTEKYGTHQCMLAAKEALLSKTGKVVDKTSIEEVLRTGTANISERYVTIIRETAQHYVHGIFEKLAEHEYDPEAMELLIVGGGACLVRNFGEFARKRVTIIDDICANAKGFEYIAEGVLAKQGGVF